MYTCLGVVFRDANNNSINGSRNNSCRASGMNSGKKSRQSEELISSKEWLKKQGVSAITTGRFAESSSGDVTSLKKVLRHMPITLTDLSSFESQVEREMKRCTKRLKWLLSGILLFQISIHSFVISTCYFPHVIVCKSFVLRKNYNYHYDPCQFTVNFVSLGDI